MNCKDDVVALYERNAGAYDRDRTRSLQEREWLDRFLSRVTPGGTVLDVGCGMGEPIARYIIESGARFFGVDASPSMIQRCRARFPQSDWIVADMRDLDLGRRFDGIIAWDSFFHLGIDDQRRMFARFAAHIHDGAPLMFTSGTEEGEAIGYFQEQPLYHASLDAPEYERLLAANDFIVKEFRADDPGCGNHTVWLATRRSLTSENVETVQEHRSSAVGRTDAGQIRES